MAYYFECKECNHKETFADTFEIPLVALEGKLADYESVICSGCITNHLIIERN